MHEPKVLNLHVMVVFLQLSLFLYFVQNTLCIEIASNKSNKCWKSGTECFLSLETFIMCDPDNLLKNKAHEKDIHSQMIAKCRNTLQEKDINYDEVKKVLVYITEIDAFGGTKISSIEDLQSCLIRKFNLTSEQSLLVIVKWENFKVTEWFSALLKNNSSRFRPNPTNDPEYIKLYGVNKDVETSVTAAYVRMCEIVEKLRNPHSSFEVSSILWIILAFVMTVGLTSFACWVYKFNKSHPTDDIQEETEMSVLETDTNQLPGSKYILTNSKVEAISPNPDKINPVVIDHLQ